MCLGEINVRDSYVFTSNDKLRRVDGFMHDGTASAGVGLTCVHLGPGWSGKNPTIASGVIIYLIHVLLTQQLILSYMSLVDITGISFIWYTYFPGCHCFHTKRITFIESESSSIKVSFFCAWFIFSSVPALLTLQFSWEMSNVYKWFTLCKIILAILNLVRRPILQPCIINKISSVCW